MLDYTNTQQKPPTNWQDFQLLCTDLWRQIWNDPGTQPNGRSGQPQHGVDICGRPNRGSSWEGIQCKGKDTRYGKTVTNKELWEEVKKAKAFSPRIDNYILATTAPDDGKIQQIAREITADHLKQGLFSVEVWGWDSIHQRLTDYPQVYEKWYGPLNSKLDQLTDDISLVQARQVAELSRSEDRQVETLTFMKEEMMPLLRRLPENEIGSNNPIDAYLNEDIDLCRDWITQRKSGQALEQLERLRDRHWDKITERTKFRITTNISAARLALGDDRSAANGFLEAIQYDPQDEKGLCNVALAHILLGNPKEALKIARKIIKLHPKSGRAHSLIVASLVDKPSVKDPTDLVPSDFWEIVDVAFVFGRFFLKRGNTKKAQEWMERVYKLAPDEIDTQAGFAEAILLSIVPDEAVAKGGALSESQRAEVEKARDLLRGVWASVKDSGEARRYIVHAFNLSSAEYLLGDSDRALAVIMEASLIDASDSMLQRQLALFKMMREEFDDAVTILRELPDDSFAEKVPMEADALRSTRRPGEALEKINSFLASDPPPELLSTAKKLRVELIADIDGPSKALEATLDYLELNPNDVQLLIALSEIQAALGREEDSRATVHNLKNIIELTNSYTDRFLAAEVLFKHSMYRAAAGIYETLIGAGGDSHAMRRLLFCLIETDQRRATNQILETLSDAVKREPFYLKMAGVFNRRIGKLEPARKNLSSYLEHFPGDLRVRLGWAEVTHKLGDRNSLKRFLEGPLEFPEALPEDLMPLSNLLSVYNMTEKAVNLAYKTLRRFPNSPIVHLGYFMLLVQTKSPPEWQDSAKVTHDSAFLVE